MALTDAYRNFAITRVETAPTPATSGTSLTVVAGQGARFDPPPFNLTVWPNGELPDPSNAEIVRVTAMTGDTVTAMDRAQEGTTARAIRVGDLIAQTITKQTLDELAADVQLSAETVLLGRGQGDGAGPAQEITLSNAFIMTGTELTVRTGVFNYTYNSSTAEPPSAGQTRVNVQYPWTGVTKLWLRFVSADGQDLYWGIMLITEGATLLLQDKDDHTRYVRFTTMGSPIDKGLYAELPVERQAVGAAINTAQQVFLQVAGTIGAPGLLPELAARVASVEQRLNAIHEVLHNAQALGAVKEKA